MQRASRKSERALGERGRVLVRWSGTEPKLRVMVEGEAPAPLAEHAARILEAATRDLAV